MRLLLLVRRLGGSLPWLAGQQRLGRARDVNPSAAGSAGHLLLVEQSLPRSGRDAGAQTLLQFIRTFQEYGWQVSICGLDGSVAWCVGSFGVGETTYAGRPPWIRLDSWWQSHGHRFDAVLVSRPTVAAVVLPVLLRRPPRRLFYYGHDLHYQRLEAEAVLKGQRELHLIAGRFRKLERAIWRACHYSFYPSEQECVHARALEPGVDIEAVAAYRFDPDSSCQPQIPPGKRLLFVGNFLHEPNVDAVCWLVEEIWPRVLQECSSSQLLIAGAAMASGLNDWLRSQKGVIVLGWLEEASLMNVYRSARVVVAPLRFGAGVKHKVVDALAQGRPVVTTPVGLQGLEFLNAVMPCSADPSSLAASCLELLWDDDLWLMRARQCQSAVMARFSGASQWQAFRLALNMNGMVRQ